MGGIMRTSRCCIRSALTLLLFSLCFSGAWAGTSGVISGTITDTATGKPLPAASVTIVGTTMGGMTDETGDYALINVPAGSYSVRASVIGYKPVVLENVQVAPDFSTSVNVKLEQTVATVLEAMSRQIVGPSPAGTA